MNLLDIEKCFNNSAQLLIIAVICAYYVKATVADKDIFYKYLKFVAIVSSLFLITQHYLYTTSGYVLSGSLPLERVTEIQNSITYGRPNSFFNEPAHFSIYVLPVYALSLKRRNYITSIVLLVALFLSTSTTGIVAGIIVTAIYIFLQKRIHLVFKIIFVLLGITGLILYLPVLVTTDTFTKMSFGNLINNVRVFGTLKYFKYFSLVDIIFGVGLNQLETFLANYTNASIYNIANAFVYSIFSFELWAASSGTFMLSDYTA
jgi:hypothetical protein